jgi:acetylornithine deacetylase
MQIDEARTAGQLEERIATDAIELLGHLISFDTTSSRSNLELIAFVEAYLARHDIRAERVANPSHSKANLVATIGAGKRGGIILSGHTDVVPVLNQQWTSDPFTLVRRGERLYGRGTSDMKSFIALALATVPALARAKASRPVHLAFSYDEEVGCLGAPAMIERLLDNGHEPMAAIVGEPTEMQVVNSHKSIHIFEVAVTGREAHSSLVNHGVSANMVAIDLLGVLAGIARAERDRCDARFQPEFSSLTVGKINGGTAANILARECRFTFDLRCIPDRDPEAVLEPFWRAVENARRALPHVEGGEVGIEVRRLAAVPSLRQERNGVAEQLSALLSDSKSAPLAVPYSAEAGQFQRAGWSTVICGPGSIVQAHRGDEYIELSQIQAGARFMRKLVEYVTAH